MSLYNDKTNYIARPSTLYNRSNLQYTYLKVVAYETMIKQNHFCALIKSIVIIK